MSLDLIVRWIYLVYVSGAKDIGIVRQIFRRLKLSKVAYSVSNHLPLYSIDERIVDRPLSFFRGSIKNLHDPDHDYWQNQMQVSVCHDISKAPPSLVIAGWYDLFLNGQLADWMCLQSLSSVHYLIIGPWHHWHFKRMASVVESAALQWLRVHLCGDNVTFKKQARLFVSGVEEWEDFDHFPPLSKDRKFYLYGDNTFNDSVLETDGSRSFVYDPVENPTPSVGGASFDYDNAGSLKQNEFEIRPDVLIFTSTPFEHNLKVIGLIAADLYVSSSAVSSDWVVRICDVDEHEISMNLTDGITRLLKHDDGPHHVRVNMAAMAHVFKKGHSIRIQVCSGAHPKFSRNSGTGQDHSLDAHGYITSTNTLHFLPNMVPYITLPCMDSTDS